MRIAMRFMVIAGLACASASPAHADTLATYWADARVKWNAIGDKAVAGDPKAKQQLIDAVAACAPETDCFRNRGQMPEADRAKLKAAWDACAKPERPYQTPSDRAIDLCRRNLTNLTQAQIDAAAAAVNVGWILGNGKMGETDAKEAFDHYVFAAEFQHPLGHYNVGKMIMGGKAGAPDLSEAASRYLKAARLGVTEGWIALGELREKNGTKHPFTDMFFAMSASEGYDGSAWYKDPDFFYRRARDENPTESQKKKIDEKLAALGGATPKPAATPAPAAPPPAPAKPQLNQAAVAAASACVARAEDMQDAEADLRAMDRDLRAMRRELDETDRILSTAYTGYEDGPAASAADWNYRNHNANIAEYEEMARDRNAFNREVNAIIDGYNAACAREWTLTKAEYAAACAGKTSNAFCKTFNFQ